MPEIKKIYQNGLCVVSNMFSMSPLAVKWWRGGKDCGRVDWVDFILVLKLINLLYIYLPQENVKRLVCKN